MSNLIGHSLGRYQILEPLGEGGMAIVYKAYDTRLESEVAVKVIRIERLAPEILQRAMKRFEREAKSLAQLTHPNLVKVLDYGEYEGQPYLVMPYLPGGTLKQKMNGQPMPWQDAARLLIPIARALDYAHKRNLIHRDVKPSNILITESGEPMLTDFGVAKIIDEEATLDLTGTSAAVGTPEYMAPEQAISKNVDHRADIYALGIVFYEMVTGRRPFQADTPLAVLFKQASEPLPRPSQFITNLPDAVEKILLKALAKRPEDRYQGMGEVVHAMESLLSGVAPVKPQPAKPVRPRERTLDTQATIDQNEDATVEDRPAPHRNSAQTIASSNPPGLLRYWPVALGIFGVLGFAAWLFFGGRLSAIPVSTPTPVFTLTPSQTPTAVFTSTPSRTPTPVFTLSPTKTFTPTLIVLNPPQHIEATIEYVKEYYGISCGFNIAVFYQSELPVKLEISWKNLSKGGTYSGGSYTPVDGKVMYYSAPSGFSSNKNAKPVPFIADGNVIQVSVRAFLEFQNQIIYSEPSLIEIQCAK